MSINIVDSVLNILNSLLHLFILFLMLFLLFYLFLFKINYVLKFFNFLSFIHAKTQQISGPIAQTFFALVNSQFSVFIILFANHESWLTESYYSNNYQNFH